MSRELSGSSGKDYSLTHPAKAHRWTVASMPTTMEPASNPKHGGDKSPPITMVFR